MPLGLQEQYQGAAGQEVGSGVDIRFPHLRKQPLGMLTEVVMQERQMDGAQDRPGAAGDT